MEWFQQAVFYELSIRAYQDSTGNGRGDFRGAIERLDHIKSLGVDCIWIMPHYASPLLDGGYDISDYRTVHPDLGTLDDFKAFLEAAHARGLRIVTDLVLNHTSDQHRWFQEARRDRNSPYREYYVWSDTGKEYAQTRIIFVDVEESNWTYDPVAGQYFWHRFYSSQPDLNYDNPKVHEEMFDIMRFWLDMGIDGFRVDAIPYLYEREGTNCENLPETHQFLQKMRRMVDAEYPNTLLIAEANMWPEELLPYFGSPKNPEFQVCFHFPIMPRLYQAVAAQNKMPIEEIWQQTPAIPEGAQWMTFLRNHDELTLEMVKPEVRQWMWAQYAPQARMKLNLGIRRRLLPLLGGDKRKWFLLNALLLALPGTPILYYGDEIGMGDNIQLPDRHGVRTPMQWDGSKNGGFSNTDVLYSPVIADYPEVNVAVQEDEPRSYLNLTRHLLRVRGEHSALQYGGFEFVETGNVAVLAFRRFLDGQSVFCLFNLSAGVQGVDLEGLEGKRPYRDILQVDNKSVDLAELQLVPHAVHWLVEGANE